MTKFADLAALSEAERIDTIGRYVVQTGKVAGFFVDDNAKADRYISQLQAKFPVRIIHRGPGPTCGSILVKVERATVN